MSELTELLARFKRGPEVIAALLTGAAGAELDYRPAPHQWSVRMILAHLADAELVAAVRLRATIAEEHPRLQTFDQDAWAEKLEYTSRKITPAMETFRRTRGENYELIKDLPEEVFRRTCEHPERGVLTLRDLVEIGAAHAEAHARQIQETRQAYKVWKAQSGGQEKGIGV